MRNPYSLSLSAPHPGEPVGHGGNATQRCRPQPLGRTDISMVQRHYGHLAKNYLEAQVLHAAPRFV